MSVCLLAIKLLFRPSFFGERIRFTIASIRWGAKTFRRWFPITYVFSVVLCSFPLVVTADNARGSAYVYGGVESAAKLIHDAERGRDPSLSVAIDRGYSDTDRHARDGKLNLVRVDGRPAMAYSLTYYGGLGYLPALVVTCRESGLLEFSQILWDSNEIDYKQYEPYLLEYQGYGLDDLFKLNAEVESVVDFRGTTVRFRGTIRTDDPGIERLGSTTNLHAYIRFSGLSSGTDNSEHAKTLKVLIDHCAGQTIDHPVRPVEASQPDSGTVSGTEIENCGPTPRDYEQLQYGEILYSLEAPCQRIFSPKEQLFVAGMSQHLLSECGFPQDIPSRLKLQKFLTSSALVGAIGRQYGNPNLGEGLRDQGSSSTVYVAGGVTAKAIGCAEGGKQLAANVVDYLDRTAVGSSDKPSYVNDCAEYYSGRYTKQQCQCLADIGRSVFPNIYETAFSPSSIKRLIESNPFVGLQIAFQCQIGDY